ncbi:MAG: hypothetical protein ABII10_00940 [Candidatus Paceibacterota bacterium]
MQQTFLIIFALFNFLVFLKAFHECKTKKNAFGLTPLLTLIGAFVWADAVVFGLFWTIVSLAAWLMNDWLLFLLVVSLFWVVRSAGETIYWFNQQFSTVDRNPPEKHMFYSIFHNDSVWFVHQIIWQCVTVLSAVASLYFGWAWLQALPNGL